MRRWWMLLVAALLLSGCGLGSFTPREMSQGERLYRANCRACHTLPQPSKYSDTEWPELVKRYGERIELNTDAQQQILDYLVQVN